MRPILHHVLNEVCQDPDCELHNLDVALEEQVIGDTAVSYFLAGFQVAARHAWAGEDLTKPLEKLEELVKAHLETIYEG